MISQMYSTFPITILGQCLALTVKADLLQSSMGTWLPPNSGLRITLQKVSTAAHALLQCSTINNGPSLLDT